MNEAGVGSILQQAPDQVRQQILVGSDRRIDAYTATKSGRAVERFAHPMQALEFERRIANLFRQHLNCCNRVCIVCRELRINRILRFQHLSRTGQEMKVRARLRCEDRKVRIPLDMRMLDFAVPIRPFDQAHHEAMPCLGGQILHTFDYIARTLLIGLNGQTKTIPILQ